MASKWKSSFQESVCTLKLLHGQKLSIANKSIGLKDGGLHAEMERTKRRRRRRSRRRRRKEEEEEGERGEEEGDKKERNTSSK